MTQTKPLTISSVSKQFNTNHVLRNVSLSVKPGEIYGLIGVNGVGKTTLIKIILNLLRQDKGNVKFFGQDVSLKKSRQQLAYLPEKFHPSPFLKGKEFLSLTSSFYGKKLDLSVAKEKAQILGLDPHVLDYKISKYSKGMGQKLGLLSVFLVETPLLLLDEPMSGLDPRARIQLKALLEEYKQQGNTVFFSSHILSDIEEICDRMAVMHQGKLTFEGSPTAFLKSQKEKNIEKAFLKAISD